MKEEVEMETIEDVVPEQLGNAAAMREALKQAMRVLHCSIVAEILNGEDAHEALNAVTTALSAPPRNCDLFDTKDKAREAFQKLRGHRILADVSLWDDRDEIEALFDWLFAKPKGEPK